MNLFCGLCCEIERLKSSLYAQYLYCKMGDCSSEIGFLLYPVVTYSDLHWRQSP